MVQPIAIAFMILSTLIAISIPAVFYMFFKRKYGNEAPIAGKVILVGALTFLVFSQVLEKMLHVYVLQTNPQTVKLLQNMYLYALYGGLAAGLFEEVGRYVAFRYFLKPFRRWVDGIAFGIGHGGIEALLIGALTGINNIVFSFMINSGAAIESEGSAAGALAALKDTLINTPPYLFLFGGIERAFALVLHVALSIIVLYSVRTGRLIYLVYAIALHAAIDFFVIFLYQILQIHILVVEGMLFVVALLALGWLRRSRALFD